MLNHDVFAMILYDINPMRAVLIEETNVQKKIIKNVA
jgi:hypothetical protein